MGWFTPNKKKCYFIFWIKVQYYFCLVLNMYSLMQAHDVDQALAEARAVAQELLAFLTEAPVTINPLDVPGVDEVSWIWKKIATMVSSACTLRPTVLGRPASLWASRRNALTSFCVCSQAVQSGRQYKANRHYTGLEL